LSSTASFLIGDTDSDLAAVTAHLLQSRADRLGNPGFSLSGSASRGPRV
jgi:hypothetical protein